MKYFYSTYVRSDCRTCHEDNVLIAADSPEEAKAKVEAWVVSMHRELDRMDEPFAIPRNEFVGGWHKHKSGWRWYEANAFGTRKNGRFKVFFGYIFAPNMKFVKDKIVEMDYPAIGYICRGYWNVYIK